MVESDVCRGSQAAFKYFSMKAAILRAGGILLEMRVNRHLSDTQIDTSPFGTLCSHPHLMSPYPYPK